MNGKFWEVDGCRGMCRRCVWDVHIIVFLAQDFDWSLSTNASPAFSLHVIATASQKLNHPALLMSAGGGNVETWKCAADDTASQITAHEMLRYVLSTYKGSAVGIDPPFPCLICSYLPCHSTWHTAPFLKMILVLREPSTPSEPDCKNTEPRAENEWCTRQWPQCLASCLLSCWEVCLTNSPQLIQTCWSWA